MLPRCDTKPEAAHSIRRQIRKAENVRFLSRLPGFELDRELPTEFLELLGKLHKVEDGAAVRSRAARSER